MDIAWNSVDSDIREKWGNHFQCYSIWYDRPDNAYANHFDVGVACDVMEHLPEIAVPLSLRQMLKTADTVIFSICLTKDVAGPSLIGEPLHLTVKNANWWKEQIMKQLPSDRSCDIEDLQPWEPEHYDFIVRHNV